MKPAFVFMATAAFLVTLPATAQNPAPPPSASPPGDMPGLGEIMTVQQLRHIKLWFAGSAGNWPLANYEIAELNEGFEGVSKIVGGDTVETMVGAPLKDLQKAIDNRNRNAFMAGYDGLTAGCNNCHRALERQFIAIQRPALLPYSDQLFTPQK